MSRKLTMYFAPSCKSKNWNRQQITLEEFNKYLENPVRSSEKVADFMQLSKDKQLQLKDSKGGYIFSVFAEGTTQRIKANMIGHDVIMLDIENVPAGTLDIVEKAIMSQHVQYTIYTTRKHMPEKPRFRVLIPLNRTANPDEYDAVARYCASIFIPGMEGVDPTTFDQNRLSFWPTLCADSEYIFRTGGNNAVDVDMTLGIHTFAYGDWRNWNNRPQVPGENKKRQNAAKQTDPRTKDNIVGAFCRKYDIRSAMDTFLLGVYEQVENDQNRYTYREGSTSGGAVVYDDIFLYSHHATDPCSNKLVNPFDLVRLHKFGDKDIDIKPDTPNNKRPSYLEMVKLAEADPDISADLKSIELEKAKEEFKGVIEDKPPDDETLERFLEAYEGSPISLNAVQAAMDVYGYKIRRNMIIGTTEVMGLPAKYSKGDTLNTFPVILKDLLKAAKISGVTDNAICGYLGVIADENRYNPVEEMIRSAAWDEQDRIGEIYQILGINTSFEQILVRKWLIQTIAMVMNDDSQPIGAEGVLTLQGDEGLGKTRFFKVISYSDQWFTEGLTLDIQNKDSILKSINCWICELGELDSTSKKEQAGLKGHLTAVSDKIREPYAKAATLRARRTSYCATVNPEEFLTSSTGYRRFWIIRVSDIDKDSLNRIEKDKAWIQQLWAQVYELWDRDHDSFRLTDSELAQVMKNNEQFQLMLPGEEELRNILDWSLPVDQWQFIRAGAAIQRAHCYRITPKQMGLVLAKLHKENPQIEKRDRQNSHEYLLPLSGISLI